MKKPVEIKLHGKLGKKTGMKTWNLHVQSVSEALHAINKLSDGKLFRQLGREQKKNQKFKILINDEPWKSSSDIRFDHIYDNKDRTKKQLEAITNSELRINNPKLKKIDIVPVVEGADEVFTIVFAIIIIIIGIVLIATGHPYIGSMIVMAGIGLLAAGIAALLMDPPEMADLKTLEGAMSASYLFNGPVNITKEGGPVPICYGELLCGSQTLAAYYDIYDVEAASSSLSN
jgi:predicted phage tail protein